MATWDTPTIRCDGLMISKTAETTWVIRPSGQRWVVEVCPLCDKFMESADEARRVADRMFEARAANDTDPPQAA